MENNESEDGGGLFININNQNNNIKIYIKGENSVFNYNKAQYNGGALYILADNIYIQNVKQFY